nr:type I polyketide synthase [Amycolatopsis sp. CA-230715]
MLPTYAFQRGPRAVHAAPDRAGEAVVDEELRTQLAGLPERQQIGVLAELIIARGAALLGVAAEDIAPDHSFLDLGLDSQALLSFRNELMDATGLRLPVTVVFDHPTPAALAGYLRRIVAGDPDETRVPVTGARPAAEPIAIVGMSCRAPGGVRTPHELWQSLVDGVDAIGALPVDRGWDMSGWDGPVHGGFLHDAGSFDAGLFGISPREALSMDPQQRLVLEASWEALENAGIAPDSLHGSRTAVFVGAITQDYGPRMHAAPEHLRGHLVTGGMTSVVSGRVAYAFGLAGSAVTLDTACSSSIVTLHLAAQALRRGECSLALAGGVTVLAAPGLFHEFSRQGGLAPDGRCKAFAAAADGTGWAEGIGILALERLSDAERNGHRVLAVIRGSAVNSDGASNGLAAPNGLAQQRLIADALADAGLDASEVDAVEAHGTGTRLGDPVEAQALLAAYGRGRAPDRPLWLGSLKSNIGHTLAAAGVLGVVKMVQAVRHGVLPKTLHVAEPSPHVDWSAGSVELLTEQRDWPRTGAPRRAGISAFGISGTNAHLILEQAPDTTAPVPREDPGAARPLVLSGASPAAVRAQARRLVEFLDANPTAALDETGLALATTRAGLRHRAAVVGGSREEVRSRLGALASGRSPVRAVLPRPTLAFLLPGQGSQRAGMGGELAASFPVFAEALGQVCALFDGHLPDPLSEIMTGGDARTLGRTANTQAALFAFEVAAFRLVGSWGVRPDVVLGHSVGELAAAHLAGVLSLADAVKLVAARGLLMQELPAGGGMLAVDAAEDEVSTSDEVALAAVNGPRSVVLSGDAGALRAVAEHWSRRGRRTRMLRVSHAFHSPRMEPMLARFDQVAREVTFRPPFVPIVSTVTGAAVAPDELCSPGYWVDQVRRAVRFHDGMRTLSERGVNLFLDLGPDGALAAMGEDCLADRASGSVRVVPGCRKDVPEDQALVGAVAELHSHGAPVDWRALFGAVPRLGADLPGYAFQRERYWLDPVARADDTASTWRYEVVWQPCAAQSGAALSGCWLVVIPSGPHDGSVVGACVRGMEHSGAEVRELVVDPADDRDTLAERLRGLEPAGVLSFLGLDRAPGPCSSGLGLSLDLMRALETAAVDAPLWCVTQCAVSAPGHPDPVRPAQAPLWGLGRVAALEYPERWGGLIDLGETVDDGAVAGLVTTLSDVDGEDQVAVRGHQRLGRRLTRIRSSATGAGWVPRGTVLVTGGTGGLGAAVARWAARSGAKHLVLTSRRGLAAPGAAELRDELRALGAEVSVESCDVADREALAELLAGLSVTAVVHAAGVDRFGPLSDLTREELADTLAAKVTGAANLDELLDGRSLDAFVLFSSIAGVWGSREQGAYAAANAFLDALALDRHRRRLPATAIAWGPWDGAGMAERTDTAALRRRGLRLMAPAAALAELPAVLRRGEPAEVVADVDWPNFGPTFTVARPSPLLACLPEAAPSATGPAGEPADPELPRLLAGKDEDGRRRVLLNAVLTEVASVLDHAGPAAVEPDRVFQELGFDSVMAVDLRKRLAAATGLALSSGVVFDHPTPEALAEHLLTVSRGTGHTATKRERAPEDEPIAIIGMACRFPGGVESPERLWDLVAAGRDAIDDFPCDRNWPVEPGYRRAGGFLDGAADFDAEFFGISPREAVAMDPQQRIFLEASWELFERAGIDPRRMRGSRTGVFAGTNGQDYGSLTAGTGQGEGYRVTGEAGSVLSGRVAYTFGLEGPALTVDTACSSSLVALHLACQSLRQDECELAIAGGVTVMATSRPFAEFARQGGLAADGRCKAFSAAADGTGWAEGAGLLLVERLSDARRNRHRVLAVIRGSAVNSDGRSNGLAAPNGPSQERVITDALTAAGLSAAQVDAVEGHGTGTALGDPIEINAVLATYGRDRNADRPLWLGSVKSNLGHTQAAAGVAGVIKMVQAIRNGILPATLHVDEPTPHADWSTGAVSVLTSALPWPDTDGPRRAGVSAFGISGTNAHAIIEQAPENFEESVAPALPWVLSGATEAALRAQAARLSAHVAACPDVSTEEIGAALATTRAALRHRAAVVADDRDGFIRGLDALAGGSPAPGVVTGSVTRGADRPVFVFPGQGAHWPGMAAGLLAESEIFRDRMRECAEALAEFVDWSLIEAVTDQDTPLLARVDVVQPAMFAMMVSLAELWRSYGLEPAAVVGHSQGEIAAACVAGGLSLRDATAIVALRSKELLAVAGQGGMVSVAAPVEDVTDLMAEWRGSLSVAAVNGPRSLVVAGAPEALAEWTARCKEVGIRTKTIPVDYASHSSQMDALEERVRAALSGIRARSGRVPFFSTVTGDWMDTADLDAGYWFGNLRGTVRFAEATAALAEQGHGTFVEVSPNPVLTAAMQETVELRALPATVTGTLRRGDGVLGRFFTALGQAHAHGAEITWPAARDGHRVGLPTYAFQRERYWPEPAARAAAAETGGHPLVSAIVDLADGGVLCTARIGPRTHPWLADHRCQGTPLVPATAFVELAVLAGERAGSAVLTELTIEAPLPLPERGVAEVQVRLSEPDGSGTRQLVLCAREEYAARWAQRATGVLSPLGAPAEDELAVWPPDGAVEAGVAELYDGLEKAGFDYGPGFRGLSRVWRRGEVVFAEASLPDHLRAEADRYRLHPALLDAALHAVSVVDGEGMPFVLTGVALHATGAGAVRARITPTGPDSVSVLVADTTGRAVATIDGLVLRPPPTVAAVTRSRGAGSMLQLDWTPVAAPAVPSSMGALAGLSDVDFDALLVDGTAPQFVTVPVTGEPGPVAPAARLVLDRVLELAKAWLADERFAASRLVFVTREAVAAGDRGVIDLVCAPVWGLIRAAQSENPGRFVLVDAEDTEDTAAVAAAAATGEPQSALRGGTVFVPGLRARAGREALREPVATPWWRLTARTTGTVEGLALTACPERGDPLAHGQVRVGVRAAGVNFRDVLKTLGVVEHAAELGSEVAGVVLATGPGVTELRPGDRVMGMVDGGFGPLAVTDHRLLMRIPEGWSYGEAATVPVVFLTAYHALAELGELRAGESLLVHAAAGGVGLAAVQLAGHLGAEVYATASAGKWRALRDAGIADRRIASSRTLEFREDLLRATGGRGVDVVLNCLAGPFVDASLDLLPRGGRFLELGKTDIRDATEVVATHPGVSYAPFDVLELGTQRIGRIFAELAALFTGGVLHPLPSTTWDVRRAQDAFRALSEARLVGKAVLRMPPVADQDAEVLVTGASGVLAGLVARRLVVEHGVRNLLLVSRRGPGARSAVRLQAELLELGARATLVACDVTDRAALARLLDGRRLGGVVHAAGALNDVVLREMDPGRLAAVLPPKIDAAWHLHELTEHLPLSFFVLFSSASAVLGTAGQGNYAAGNVFLDALAHYRHAAGLPATALAWGLWEERSAMTAHLDDRDLGRLARVGIRPLRTEDGLDLFDEALFDHRPALVPIALDSAAPRGEELPPVLRGVFSVPRRAVTDLVAAEPVSLAERLAALAAEDQLDTLVELIGGHLGAVLGHRHTGVEPDRAFRDLGFDSLTAVELRNRLQTVAGRPLPATVVFDHPTPIALARYLRTELVADAENADRLVRRGLDQIEALLPEIEAEAELAARLRKMLWTVTGSDEVTVAPVADRLRVAGADELLEFIDSEFGDLA